MKKNAVKLSTAEKLSLFSNLATMMAAGIPILEAAESLVSESKAAQQVFLTTFIANLKQGKKISDSLQLFDHTFDQATISVMKAAEESGKLEEALNDLTINYKKQAEFNAKIRSALTYPFLVMLVFVGVVVMILMVVMPRVSDVFKRLNIVLPLLTRILIFLSDLLVKNTAVIGFAALFLIVLFIILIRWQGRTVKRFLLRVPGLRKFGQEVDLAVFSRTMALLLSAGIPITEAIELSKSSIVNNKILQAITTTHQFVTNGRPLSEGLQKHAHLFPVIMRRMIESGEKSGTLEKAMQDAADFFESRVEASVKQMTTLLEPLLLVVIGLLVGGMMLAILTPIYGLIGQLGAR